VSVRSNAARDLGEEGLGEALTRLQARLAGQESGNALVSLGEVLSWLFALREFHGLQPPRASVDEETLQGLIFARHQVAHRLENLAEIVSWPSTPLGMGHGRSRLYSFLSELRWKERADLHATDPHPTLETLYDKHVAEKPLLEPIEVATQFVLGLP